MLDSQDTPHVEYLWYSGRQWPPFTATFKRTPLPAAARAMPKHDGVSSSARPPRLLQAAEVLGHFARLLVRVRTPEQTILTLGSMALSVFFVDADCTNIQLNAMGLLCEIFAQYPANRLHFVGELCDLLPKLPKVGNHAQPHRRSCVLPEEGFSPRCSPMGHRAALHHLSRRW